MSDIADPGRESDPTEPTEEQAAIPSPRDVSNWATKVERLAVDPDRAKAGFNVAGRRLTGPQQGFGRLRQRTYTVDG
ncbi:MAG: hypothetical protein ACRDN1_24350, partial [Trebonia sp.]